MSTASGVMAPSGTLSRPIKTFVTGFVRIEGGASATQLSMMTEIADAFSFEGDDPRIELTDTLIHDEFLSCIRVAGVSSATVKEIEESLDGLRDLVDLAIATGSLKPGATLLYSIDVYPLCDTIYELRSSDFDE